MKSDVLTILEAAYTPSDTLDGWIQGTLDALGPHLSLGAGVIGHPFVVRDGNLHPGSFRATEDAAGQREQASRTILGVLEAPPSAFKSELLRRMYPLTPTAGWQSEFAGPVFRALNERTSSFAGDAFGLVASEPSGHGCLFFAGAKKRSPLPAATRAMWTRVTAHLAMGYRLAREPDAEPEAVLSPAGKLVHAEAPASGGEEREALSRAARAMDRARGRLRRVDLDEALSIWTGLVRGTWSLVEQFDHDGRRHVVAKRNAPKVRAWTSMTTAEAQVLAYAAKGQSHKFIAYELGMSVSMVATHLGRAARKVGATSRLELIAAYNAAQEEGGTG